MQKAALDGEKEKAKMLEDQLKEERSRQINLENRDILVSRSSSIITVP